MKQYLDALQYVLDFGERASNRTGVDTLSVFGYQMRFDLRRGFPAVTTKKLQFKSVVKELLWFLRGDTNTQTLGCGIWDQWANKDGEVSFCYGQMWRRWPGQERNVDQIAELIERMNNDPDSRRHIICAWHPEYQDEAGLAWCHAFVQFKLTDEFVDCSLTQRSCDLALGVPFNIASYALLTELIARRTGRQARWFNHFLNDMHIYVNHIDNVKLQLQREPKPLPKLIINNPQVKALGMIPQTINCPELWHYQISDIDLANYEHHPAIGFEIAV